MKTAAQLDREIGQFLTGKRRIAHVGFGTYESSKRKISSSLWDADRYKPGRADMRDPTLPKGETFACIDRNGAILGTSKSVEGAMAKAPAGSSYALVRGEYVSTGHHYGVGRGRQMAVREGGRWIRG
jgi:hypothetical protein